MKRCSAGKPRRPARAPDAYTTFKVGDRHSGGLINMDDKNLPKEIPPHWLTFCTVEDCAATAAKAEKLGGKVMKQPTKIPEGTFAVMTDPRGSALALIS